MLGIGSTLDGRISRSDRSELVFMVGIHPDILHADDSMSYGHERLRKIMPTATDEHIRLVIRNHPRYIAGYKNLKDFTSHLKDGETPILEYRVKIVNPLSKDKPCLCVSDELVLPSEDAGYFGTSIEVTKFSGTTVVYELKERNAPFTPVDWSGFKMERPAVYSPVRPGFAAGLSGIPEEIATPRRDDSSISSNDEGYVYAEAEDEPMEADDESSAEDVPNPPRMPAATMSPQEMMEMMEMYQVYKQQQQQQFHIRHSGLSVSSKTTRGTEDREAKRKTPVRPQVSPAASSGTFGSFGTGFPASNLASFASLAGGQGLSTINSEEATSKSSKSKSSKKYK
jgi:hypothetical protein